MNLHLPKTRLRFDDGKLCRFNEDGTLAAEHNLADAESVRLVRAVSWRKAGESMLAVVAMWWLAPGIESAGWRETFLVFFTWVTCSHLTEIGVNRLRIVTRAGKVEYRLEDAPGVCEGFMMSVDDDLERRKGQA